MEILERIWDNAFDFYKNHEMKTLGVVKYTSIVASPILAAFAAVRTIREIEKRKGERGEDLTPKEKLQIAAQNAIVPVIATGAALYATATVDKKNADTINALTTAVVLGEEKYKELKEAQKEVVGEEKSEDIEKKANEKALAKIDTSQVQTNPAMDIYACREPKKGQIWATTPKQLDDAITYVLRTTASGKDVSLQDFIVEAGGDPTELGELYIFPGKLGAEYNIFYGNAPDRNGRPGYYIMYGVDSQPRLAED